MRYRGPENTLEELWACSVLLRLKTIWNPEHFEATRKLVDFMVLWAFRVPDSCYPEIPAAVKPCATL